MAREGQKNVFGQPCLTSGRRGLDERNSRKDGGIAVQERWCMAEGVVG